jgi:sugar lactone lactonase YvrE/enterochelin esterase-like enzyme
MKRFFAGLLVALVGAWVCRAEDQAAVPKGTVTKYTFEGSAIFPGTVRDYWVYVPAQYDGSKPACVHVNQDNVQFNLPAVMDRLIASGEMPVTVGVFVAPGKVKALSTNALDRFNRSFEYDGLGDGYARFLLTELLPHVVREQKLNLSANGNDRSIGGSSSGAVCAFTAAWERPDAFSRVLSAVGTYVGLRGGNDYPTLIRKTEPKALRVFLQDGSADLNIYCGDWWMANQEMDRALAFAGYEVNHVWGDGGHSGKHMTEICADAMRWLWKDWPAPIQKGLGSQQMKDILLPGEGWQLVGSGYAFTEGPAANAKGEVYFNDIPNSKTWKVGLDGSLSVIDDDSKKANGMVFGADGRRYAVSAATRQVVAADGAGKTAVVAEGIAGNDLAIRADGSLYVTAPGNSNPAANVVWLVRANGAKVIVDTGLKFPNGVALSPDQSLLYVCDTLSHWVYSYQIQPDGTLAHKQRYYFLHQPHSADESGADGMRCDRDGRLYVATKMGIQVCDQTGRVNVILPTPNGRCANLCFGGPDFDTLYATCGDSVFKRKLKARGMSPAAGPVKPAAPRL